LFSQHKSTIGGSLICERGLEMHLLQFFTLKKLAMKHGSGKEVTFYFILCFHSADQLALVYRYVVVLHLTFIFINENPNDSVTTQEIKNK
jgi:hypothetical protein